MDASTASLASIAASSAAGAASSPDAALSAGTGKVEFVEIDETGNSAPGPCLAFGLGVSRLRLRPHSPSKPTSVHPRRRRIGLSGPDCWIASDGEDAGSGSEAGP